jgi:hypothetical protein
MHQSLLNGRLLVAIADFSADNGLIKEVRLVFYGQRDAEAFLANQRLAAQ